METATITTWSVKMVLFSSLLILLLGGCGCVQAQAEAQNFTIINGQIFTPGLAIVDSPQPGTPEGGGMSMFTMIPMPCVAAAAAAALSGVATASAVVWSQDAFPQGPPSSVLCQGTHIYVVCAQIRYKLPSTSRDPGA
jgi:hypothetical protein